MLLQAQSLPERGFFHRQLCETRHSERSPRSEVRFYIARFLCDESLLASQRNGRQFLFFAQFGYSN